MSPNEDQNYNLVFQRLCMKASSFEFAVIKAKANEYGAGGPTKTNS